MSEEYVYEECLIELAPRLKKKGVENYKDMAANLCRMRVGEGAVRELAEETKIYIPESELELVIFVMITKSDGTPGLLYLYKHEAAGQYVPTLDHEHEAWGYFTIGNYPKPLDKILKGVI